MPSRRDVLKSLGPVALALGLPRAPALADAAPRTLSVTTTGSLAIVNPYGDSSSLLYSVWAQTYGSLGRFNYLTQHYEGILAKEWRAIDETHWRFTLRDDLRRHDGGPGPTSRDVLHSWQRTLTDPASAQGPNFSEIDRLEAVDDHSFDVVTKRPLAQLLVYVFDLFPITSAELYEKFGKDADRQAPYGWGPYAVQAFDVDQRIVLKRNPYWPGLSPEAADVVVYRLMREPEQRVTALLNNEVQIARLIPPQLTDQLKSHDDIRLVDTGALEFMFIAMNPHFKPWDDVRARQAVAHAIDRDLIIKRLLFGMADRMDGALSRYQRCYAAGTGDAYGYDPAKAKALLAAAGYPDGVAIDFYTPTGRYVSDRQVSEAVAQMLTQVGFKVTLHTPEYANFFSDIQAGRCPIYYMGRGAQSDASAPLSQYFETGVTKRIGFSDPDTDALFQKLRHTFDDAQQCDVLQAISKRLVEEVPAVFMWTHRLLHGVRKEVQWTPDVSGELWLPDIHLPIRS